MTPAPPLVAVHLPKTAGTSFRAALEAAYGDGLRLDYDDRPLTHARATRRLSALAAAPGNALRPMPAAVYGHFLPVKYALVRGARFAIWLRDPVQRVASRYQHYLRDCATGDRSHARWGLVPGLSLAEFAALPQYQNTCREYLWAFPLRRFAFVGLVEHYDADLRRFADTFGLPAALPVQHANAHLPAAGDRHRLDPADEAAIRRHNAADLAIYAEALARR